MIFSPEGDNIYSITFTKDTEVNCIIIGVVRSLFLEKIRCELDSINNSISAMFDDTEGKEGFYHKTNTLPIGINKITHLLDTHPTSIEKSLLVEASVLSLISSLVKSFLSSSNLNESAYWFSNEDLGKINQVKNYIIDNLKDKTTVSEFAKMVGMNENKLQKGFQLLFHKSIKQFMITMRMHKAMSLMDENNRTISEIAFEMGYTNISHFSDLFRRGFGLLPSEYKSKINNH